MKSLAVSATMLIFPGLYLAETSSESNHTSIILKTPAFFEGKAKLLNFIYPFGYICHLHRTIRELSISLKSIFFPVFLESINYIFNLTESQKFFIGLIYVLALWKFYGARFW
jgi:hypothetical protein